MKSTKVQTLGGIWPKYWNIWIENTLACICTMCGQTYRQTDTRNNYCNPLCACAPRVKDERKEASKPIH